MDGVSLSITFSPEDVEVLETILDRYGRDLDQTGIISHILSEIEYATTTDETRAYGPNAREMANKVFGFKGGVR